MTIRFWTKKEIEGDEQFTENGEPRVVITDHLPQEANAMGMAKYSRSALSFIINLREVMKTGWQKFMQKYYVDYGHASIADCASTNVCIENASMLTAVAYEDWHTSGGQEMSTRYLDMSNQRIINPLGTLEGEEIQEMSRALYLDLAGILKPRVESLFPKKDSDSQAAYDNTVLSRICDIAGAFLPAGTVTSVGRHVTLRQLRDHLVVLRNFLLPEVRGFAKTIADAAHSVYPSSGFATTYLETEKYAALCSNYGYLEVGNYWPEFNATHTFDTISIDKFSDVLSERPRKALLPSYLNNFGQITFRHLIDFRSYRDEHRHCRSGAMYLPLLTTKFGFEEWYIDQIPEEQRQEIINRLSEITFKINNLKCSPQERQYYIPMGFKVPVLGVWGLGPITYMVDLRTGQTVHPTVRRVAKKMGNALQDIFPHLKLYCDYGPDVWSTKRGEQTIKERDTAN